MSALTWRVLADMSDISDTAYRGTGQRSNDVGVGGGPWREVEVEVEVA